MKPSFLLTSNITIVVATLLFAGYLIFEFELLSDSGNASAEEERHDLLWLIAVSSIMTGAFLLFSLRRLREQQREFLLRHQAESQAHAAERTDILTGLSNRRRFEEQASDLLSRLIPGRDQVVVMFIDLDGFKPVNDTHGHAAGDAVLLEIGRRLRQYTRATDCVARLGGDEFAVLSLTKPGTAEAMRLAEDLKQLIEEDVSYENGAVSVGATIGVALATEAGVSVTDLLRAADHGMYQGKRGGGRRITLMSEKPQLIANGGSLLSMTGKRP